MQFSKVILTGALSCSIFSVSMAQINQSFSEKVESIKNNLYKISAQELNDFLDISIALVMIITSDQLLESICAREEMLIINVLPEKYHNDCHITGSINAPLPELIHHAQSWNHSKKIVVYCALDECDASRKACILLQAMGFTDIVEYGGGIKEWFQLGYPIQGPALSDYLYIKSFSIYVLECEFPDTIVCSRQLIWVDKNEKPGKQIRSRIALENLESYLKVNPSETE